MLTPLAPISSMAREPPPSHQVTVPVAFQHLWSDWISKWSDWIPKWSDWIPKWSDWISKEVVNFFAYPRTFDCASPVLIGFLH
ncbi:hypothetical protein AVEN_148081-1 [Araneus ventricosus]|uniref:Uncharacterized protein n=1 Tax=Araneus ventricosus TaxID=182803 RepID=A0A4Y2G7C9_ARAVE|nr:hypothetical protein AVEN_148081-1 [Araneus ventricosus]